MEVLTNDMFLGEKGERTMFVIASQTLRDISRYSSIPTEKELLLLPGTVFVVESILPQAELTIIQLTEKVDNRLTLIPSTIQNSYQTFHKLPPTQTYEPQQPALSTTISDKVDISQTQNNQTVNPVVEKKQEESKVQVIKWGNDFTCSECRESFKWKRRDGGREEYLQSFKKIQGFLRIEKVVEEWKYAYAGDYASFVGQDEKYIAKYAGNYNGTHGFNLGNVISCVKCTQKLKFVSK